jgi:thymidine kinase
MVETSVNQFSSGRIEVICGPMFSGKTEELIRLVRRAQIARVKVQIFKPAIDSRYDVRDVVSHNKQSLEATPVKSSQEILDLLNDSTRVVAIDEVQFFDDGIITVVAKLARRGHRVICAGLDLDYRALPFGSIPVLLAIADSVTKLQAVCTVCGAPATRTVRLVNSDKKILIGDDEIYQARCRTHYEEIMETDIASMSKEYSYDYVRALQK